MAGLKETQILEKLNAHNYATWKFRMEMLLIKEDLFEIISENPPDPQTAEWLKKDRKARAYINLFIDDAQIVNVRSKTSARETWETLKNIHERTNLSSKLYLLRKLYSVKLSEGGDMILHTTRILEIIDQLNAIGENIAESHISALLLCSLPSSYDALIIAMEARPEEELSPEFIRSKLVDEFKRRSDNRNVTADYGAKAYQTTNKHLKQNNFRKTNKFCTNCYLNNHNISECWKINGKNKSTNTSYNNRRYSRGNYRGNNSNRGHYKSSLCFQTDHGRLNTNEVNDKQKDETEQITSNFKNIAFLTENSKSNKWVIDSGSSTHITNTKDYFTKMKNTEETEVVIANGNTVKSYGSGDANIQVVTSEGKINNITLKDVLFVPDIETNLLSVIKATQNDCRVTFENDKCVLTHKGEIYLEGKIVNNLYEVKLNKHESHAKLIYDCNNKNCIDMWHMRLGHRNNISIKEIQSKNLASGIIINNCKHSSQCQTCIKAKITNQPYPKVAQHRANDILKIVHSDLCGPFKTPSIGTKTYMLTFTDDYSRYTTIYLLNKKSEVIHKLKEFVNMLNTKFGKIPQILRTDNGGEYVNKDLENYLKEKGIQHQLTVPFCPSQNGVAERKNRTLIEMTRSLLTQANLPHRFWGEAVHTANYLVNRLPTKGNDKTPMQLWSKTKPSLSHLKVFGCKAYAYIDKSKRSKLDNKASEGIFVGYDQQSTGYRIYTGGNNIMISRTVKFIENEFPFANNKIDQIFSESIDTDECNTNTHEKDNILEIEISDENNEPVETTPETPRRSQRINKGVPPDRLIYLTRHNHIYEPKDWKDLKNIQNPKEKQCWLEATEEEYNSLIENKTWTLIDPPEGRKVIGSKWTFKAKYDSQGSIQKYKARLVAKGFSQKYGTDYDETFAPVVSHTTIRTFLAASLYKKLKVHHVDIKTAFLHGELKEEILMQQPEGYISEGNENKVCRLNKAIYGLKQAARAWHHKISESLKRLNFMQSIADSCLFVRNEGEDIMYVIVYVDDILIAGNDDQIKQTIDKLKGEYNLKDLGEVSFYLGTQIERINDECFILNQKLKIEEMVKNYNLENSRPSNIPMEPGYLKLEGDENPLPNNNKFRQAIGSLLYIATITRPDISAAVNILSRKSENPRQCDWEAVKRIIRYLNTTKTLNLMIKTCSQPILKAYADADWAGDRTNRKSTNGNLFMLGNSPIQWYTKRQSCVATSSAEAEYVSAASAAQEIIWLVRLLEDLNLTQNLPITMYEDNQSCIKMLKSEKHSSKVKHIDIKYNCIKHLRETGIIEMEYCPSKQMIADILTKPAPKPDLQRHRANLQVLPHPAEELKGEYWK